MGVVSQSIEVVLSNSLGSTTCGVRGIGQVAKLPSARAEVRLSRALGSGKARRRRCGRERGVEVTAGEQQGWRKKHENRESEMEMCDMHTANTFSRARTRCLHVTQRKSAKKMCVRHGVCVHRVAHTVVAATCVRNSEFENPQPSSFRVHLDLFHQDLFQQFAFHQLSDVRVNSS